MLVIDYYVANRARERDSDCAYVQAEEATGTKSDKGITEPAPFDMI